MKRDKHLGFKVDSDLYDKLKYVSKYEGRSLSGQLIYLANQCIREHEKLYGPITAEALAALQDD